MCGSGGIYFVYTFLLILLLRSQSVLSFHGHFKMRPSPLLPHTVLLSSPVATSDTSALSTSQINEHELTKIFCRLADSYLLLDIPGAGTPGMVNCCHSGCDNCEFARVFDCMSAGRAKWIPLYPTRTLIDGRAHVAPWARLFASDMDNVQVGDVSVADKSLFESVTLSRDLFVQRFKCLVPQKALGPSLSIDEGEASTDEAISFLWERLILSCGKEINEKTTLSAEEMATALAKITGEAHGAMWSDLRRGMLS